MCIDCDEEAITRRSFLTGATTAIAGAAFALRQQDSNPRKRLLMTRTSFSTRLVSRAVQILSRVFWRVPKESGGIEWF